jgi:hypothetical protein
MINICAYIYMPKKKVTKKVKVVKRKKVGALPRLPTGFNRDIPLGGSGGSANLLANIASLRAPPPAMPIQTPDQFNIMREQARQAKVIDLVEEEQKAVRRFINKDGTPDMRYARNREAPMMPTVDALPINQAVMKQEETVSQMPTFAEPKFSPPNIRFTRKGVPDKRFKGSINEAASFTPPVIGTGPLYEGGGPIQQQGLSLTTVGKLRGAPPDARTSIVGLMGIGSEDVFLG